MRKIIIGAALALTVTAAPAAEDTNSANFVMTGCWNFLNSSNVGNFAQGYCFGLVEGLFYTLRTRACRME
jgi:hypothetical protein